MVALAGATSLLGDRAILILMSGDVTPFVLMAFAIWIGRRSGATGRWFRAPLHPAIPMISLIYGVFAVAMDWLDPEAGRPSTILLCGLFLFGLVYYALRLRNSGKAWRIGGAAAEVPAAVALAETVR